MSAKSTLTKSLTIAAVIIALTGMLSWLIIYLSPPFVPRNNQPLVLPAAEVKEYQGQKLDSINDFVENSIKGPQYVDIKNYHLKIKGLVAKEKNLTYDEVISKFKPYQKAVKLNCVEGWSVNILWEGFLLRDLLAEAEVKPSAKTIILRSVDGYSTSFPVNYFTDNDIIIAYKMNGILLPPERGFPFQLVAESKWGYKWIKWITEIELSADSGYHGYWESRGYSNDGDLDKYYLGF